MTTTDDAAPIRITGPAGLLAAVPPLLGFHPTNSLVLLCVCGGRRRVGPVARVDLPPGHDRALAQQLTLYARMHADEVAVVCYLRGKRRPPLLDDLLGELAAAGIAVMDAMTVREGYARPALSAAMERNHPGIPMPAPDDPVVCALEAAGALSGRSVLPDRDALRRSIAGPTGSRLRAAEGGINEAAAGRMPAVTQTDTPAVVSLRRTATARRHPVPPSIWELMDAACVQVAETGTVDMPVATAVAAVLAEDAVQRAVLKEALRELDGFWLPMLISCATWTPDAVAPPLCSVLAVVAYRHGDGALAQVAVDRCLAAEPQNPLALVLIDIMSAGLRPEDLDDMIGSESRLR